MDETPKFDYIFIWYGEGASEEEYQAWLVFRNAMIAEEDVIEFVEVTSSEEREKHHKRLLSSGWSFHSNGRKMWERIVSLVKER